MSKIFLRFWKFSVIILLNILSLWFAPLLLLQYPWFSGLVFWWSHWVLAYSFHSFWVFDLRFLLVFFFFNISVLSLISGILSSTCSSLLEWPSTVYLTKGTFYFQEFCWILFSDVFHIFVQLLFYILFVIFNSYISFLVVSFVSLWCLLKSSLSSFICFYIFSCSLFLVSWTKNKVSSTLCYSSLPLPSHPHYSTAFLMSSTCTDVMYLDIFESFHSLFLSLHPWVPYSNFTTTDMFYIQMCILSCLFLCICLSFGSVFHIWEKTYSLCLSYST
jgi:hypothetical protein